MKRIIKNADEQDAYGKWGRKYLIYISRRGVRKGIKKSTHRRERREADLWIDEQLQDGKE